jgi:hypothetical protein
MLDVAVPFIPDAASPRDPRVHPPPGRSYLRLCRILI